MSLGTLNDLLVHELQDLLSAEKQLVKALPKMAKAASSPSLQEAFDEHLEQTKMHVSRLEKAFEQLGRAARAKKCEAMAGLIEESESTIEEDGDEHVKDAALIGCAQKVEHYEIASYGTARTFATLLGEDKVATLLQETLDEEGETDKRLTELAMAEINVAAYSEAEEA